MSARLRATPPWLFTAVLGLLYVAWAPASADLAAASYRSDLFSRAGFTLWDNAWYGGHHLPAYSVLAPALGALLGPRLLAALSATIATALFTSLIVDRFPARSTRLAAIWFAVGSGVQLLSGRVPFGLGLALGLAALCAAGSPQAVRRSRAVAPLLAVLTSLASPVAGAFLGLVALAWVLGGGARIRAGLLAAAALLPIGLLAAAFPEGGSQPFAASAFWPALAAALLFAGGLRFGRGGILQRRLLAGALLYAAALGGAYLLATPVGGNAVRLGALAAGPLAACVLAGPGTGRLGPRLLLAVAPLLLYWQLVAPVRDYATAAGEPSVEASYYRPLIARLERYAMGSNAPARIEVVPTRSHWEARWLAPRLALARGWERQLDRSHDAVFYSSRALTPQSYRAWLLDEAVAYVALPDAPLDPSARAEASLLRGAGARRAGLREVWRSAHWRLFAVEAAAALAERPAVVRGLDSDSFTLEAPAPGAYRVRVHFSPYWSLTEGHGCVRRGGGDWTEVDAHGTRGPLQLRVAIGFSLARVFADGPRCR